MTATLESNTDATDYGTILRVHRILAGLTQEELSEITQISPRTISQWERGRVRRPRLSTARVIIKALSFSEESTRTFLAAILHSHTGDHDARQRKA